MVFGSALGGLGGAIGNIAVLAGAAGGGGKDELKEALRIWKAIQLPEFDMRSLTAPELRILGEYFPQTYEAQVPQEVRTAVESPEARGEQVGAVQRLGQMSREGLPLRDRLATDEAALRLSGAASGEDAALRRELAERGRLGGGTEATLRRGRGQTAANLARGQGADLMQQAVENRYRATLAAGEGASRLRGQDIDLSSQQAGAVNRFNEIVANLRQQAARDSAAERAQAETYNVGTRQRTGEENVRARYGNEQENLERQNRLRQAKFGSEVTKAGGVSGALGDLSQAKYAEQAAKAEAIRGIGQGVGQAVGGVGDILGGGGFLGDDVQGLYGRRRGYGASGGGY